MASVDETFDPNDLDSIDALLDEAEQEVSENLEEEALLDEEAVRTQDVDVQTVEPESEPQIADPVEEVDRVEQVDNIESVKNSEPAKSLDSDSEDFLSKRAAAQNQSKNGLSAAEMDAIKKLVIIFGSVIIVLALALIGIGIWGALSASKGLDEETQAILNEIKSGTEQNTLGQVSSSKAMETMEKKLDALSFQMEQITADIAALESKVKVSAATPVAIAIPSDSTKSPEVKGSSVPEPVSAGASVASGQLSGKLNSVGYKVTKAQRRIDEVNRRVKKLQGQYATLLHSVKVVEKQILDQQVKAQKEKEVDKKAQEQSGYQYSDPDGAGYGQVQPDTYP
ncbi:hypothetical protein QCB45_03510 [Thiomicrorhabdus sp. ZW0627]|uniref:hypothetical protein n=1 Tax=Thiomicrorhabdus sp. ZW0627 TaxID=3039774 RepID=UPI002436DAC4|nr:hypothetical protein [Thiomicrorhabdus sp. ZW0627]MDG6773388.1 hypothetical protein [Thiomicrorhabdus sp. ZW0627]